MPNTFSFKQVVGEWFLLTLVAMTLFSPYISSWLIFFKNVPFGALLRDILVSTLFFISLMRFLTEKFSDKFLFYSFLYTVFIIFYYFILVLFSPNILSSLVGLRNIFYSFTGIALLIACHGSQHFGQRIRNLLISLGIVIGLMGIADFFSNGKSNLLLGFNPAYIPTGELLGDLVRFHLGLTRANAGIGDALTYGYVAALFCIYAAYHYISIGHQRVFKIRTLFCIALCLTGVILSMTRGAIIAVAISLLILIVGHYRWRCIKYLIIVACISAAILYYSGLIDILVGRFTESDHGSLISSSVRIDNALKSIDILSDSPVVGAGLGTQGAGQQFSTEDLRVATDNSFLWIALETGLPGFGLYLFSMMSTVLIIRKNSKCNQQFRLFIIAFVCLYLVAGFLSSALLSPTFIITFFVIIVAESKSFKGKNSCLLDEHRRNVC